jgi:hypothetical protein
MYRTYILASELGRSSGRSKSYGRGCDEVSMTVKVSCLCNCDESEEDDELFYTEIKNKSRSEVRNNFVE